MRSVKFGIVIMVILIVAALTTLLAPLAGFRIDTVVSGSMSPSLNVGDLVITSPVDDNDIHVGDVVIFHRNGLLICHRVIEINATQGVIRTQGDANEGPDPFTVPYDEVVGEVRTSVPAMGHVLAFLKSPLGLILIIALGALIYLMDDGDHKKGSHRKSEEKDGSS